MSPRRVLPAFLRPVPAIQGSSVLAGAVALFVGLTLAPADTEAAGRHATRIIPGKLMTMLAGPYETPRVAALGDVNGDGRDDLGIITFQGAPSDPQSAVRVVFGSSSANYPGSLHDLGAGGFSVRNGGGQTGQVTSAGDFDGDGLKDLLINRRTVVYGERSSADVMYAPAGDARSTQLTLPAGSDGFQSIGDFNGDGADDLATSGDPLRTAYALMALGGPRIQAIATTGVRTFRMAGSRTCVPYTLTPYGVSGGCKDYADVPAATGDVNGDGFDDLVVTQSAIAEGGRDTPTRQWVLFGRAAASSKAVDVRKTLAAGAANVDFPGAEELTVWGGGLKAWRDAPGLDFDGDGIDDLLVSRYAAGARLRGYVPGVTGTADIVLTDAALRPYVEGDPDESYDPLVASTPDTEGLKSVAAVGDLDGDGQLDGAAAWKKYADVEPGSTDPAYPRGALVIFDGDEDRLPPVQFPHDPVAFFSSPEVSGWYTGRLRFGAFETSSIETVWRRAGETQPIQVVTFWPGVTTIPSWGNMFNGTPLAPGRYEVLTTAIDEAGNRSEPETWPFEVQAPEDFGMFPPISYTAWEDVGTWRLFRAARRLGDGTVQLTSAYATMMGGVYWPKPINRSALGTNTVTSIEFDAEMSGGSPPGGGMTVALTPEQPGVEATPGTGSSLGFAPQTGIAFAMQTYKAVKTDPSSNFVGFTNGKIPGSAPVALRWLATADPLVNLRAGQFHVKVEISAQRKQAWINGSLVLSTTGDSSLGKYVQLTASTGPGQNQRHVVRNVVVKQRAG